MHYVHLAFSNYLLANYSISLSTTDAAEDDDDYDDENDVVFARLPFLVLKPI